MYPPERYKDMCVTWYVDLRQIVRAAVRNPPATAETARPSDSQDPEWTLTKTRDSAPGSTQINFYYDKRSLRRAGTATFVRVLVDYAAPQSLSGTAYHSLISQTEIDCPQRRMRVLSSKMTSARMGGGSIVWEGAGPLPWETTSADYSAATGTIVGTERSAIWLSTCLAK